MALSTIDREAVGARPRASMAARPQQRATEAFAIAPALSDAARPQASVPRGSVARGAGRPAEAEGRQAAADAGSGATLSAPAKREPAPEAEIPGPVSGPAAHAAERSTATPMAVARPASAPARPGNPTATAPQAVDPAAASLIAVDAAAAAEPATPKAVDGSDEADAERDDAAEPAAPMPFFAVSPQNPQPVAPGVPPPPPAQVKAATSDPAAPPVTEAVAGAAAAQAAAGASPAARIPVRVGRGEPHEGDGRAGAKAEGDAAALPPVAETPSVAPALTDLLPAPPPGGQHRTTEAAAPAPANPGAAPGAAPSAQAPVPLGAVPISIGLRALAGSNTFEIRLDPKDLGRVEVNLAIDKETGTVQATLVVDRPETLALLQRDAGNLQQALSQAGLDAPDGSISLSLRSDGGAAGGGSGSGERPAGDPGRPRRETAGEPPLPAALPLRLFGGGRGLDIRI